MAMKITRTVAPDGTVVYSETAQTLVDTLTASFVAPFAVLAADSNEYYSKQMVGQSMLIAGMAGVVIGDRYGESIPLLGRHRNAEA